MLRDFWVVSVVIPFGAIKQMPARYWSMGDKVIFYCDTPDWANCKTLDMTRSQGWPDLLATWCGGAVGSPKLCDFLTLHG